MFDNHPRSSASPSRSTSTRVLRRAAGVGAAGLALLVLGGATTACHRGHHGDMDPERARQMVTWKVDDVLDDIDATDAQRKAVMTTKDRLFERGLALRAEQKLEQEEVRTLLAEDRPDADRLHELVDSASARWTKFGHEVADAVLDLHGRFDKKQRAQLGEMWDERHR